MDTPVLLIVFNRPQNTKRVLDAIKEVKPKKLYVHADGPRDENDKEKCEETRKVVQQIDWDCETEYLFQDENYGVDLGGCTGITWFFDHEEYGIILEDDCLPDPSFFYFCDELLKKYKDDNRVFQISGSTPFDNEWQRDPDYSYYFSKFGSIWGWATWRRAWKYYDYNISLWPEIKRKRYYYDLFDSQMHSIWKKRHWDWIYTGKARAWDYQWLFAKLINNGLTICSPINLITNIGVGDEGGSHKHNPYTVQKERGSISFPLKHPPFIFPDKLADRKRVWATERKGFKNKLRAVYHFLLLLKDKYLN